MVLDTYPPTEKLHQIITKTSSFVSKHGGQSEIVLRVKQGGNPTFGFLMPDHHLHPYFRFLVNHQELLTEKSSVEEKKNESEKDGGALSLLGSVYGTVEDEDANEESANDSKTNESAKVDDGVKVADSNGPEGLKGAAKIATERDAASKHSLPLNDKASFIKKNPSVSAVDVVERKQINAEDNATKVFLTYDKSQSSAMLAPPKPELQIVEPTTEMKRAIDKIVDFIQKNGKELEATLVAQDVKYGMFPFLRPASLYHGYYRKVLQEAEELKSCDKGVITREEDVKQKRMDDAVKDGKHAFGSVLSDDSAKKEKPKMVSDKPKVELHNEPFKPVQPQMRVNVDANTAAAILQAARRGIRNPQLGILSGKPMDETSQSPGNDGSYPSSKSPPDLTKSTGQLISGSTVASEADSSEALSKEQKLKAERLKRAKMFVAMLKPEAQPVQQAEPSQSVSLKLLDCGISGLGDKAAKEREGSSIPSVAETKLADDGNCERRSKRNYRSRSQRDGDIKMEQGEEEEEESSMDEATEETRTDKKHSSSRKRHKHKKTRYSSKDRHSRDKHKHESSSDDEYHSRSRHRHRRSKSSDRHEVYDSSDNEGEHRHRSSKHSKHVDYSKDKRSSHHHRSRKHDKHRDSSDDEHHRHRHRSSRRKHEDSSDVEHGHRHKSSKRIKKNEKTVEEETISKSDQSDLKAAPEDNFPYPQNEPTQVSDELRAKIRAMLADTLGNGR
ncbi:PREDICTED: splicing factor, suppressor of white-apricot homolog isoform X2 [Camelina sativa]|uniref:Splicing factor, suppressor of white-apricot homolog isoform X2 n=1 Tax=Camelina sativa TaxID=90675 RepID=A0ABM0V0N1_CAMSA|nr:PREDICTED: splicing factor, suppressor of white-apricot homolog isoform X2 [Camelina sativa]XP_010449057.1 PREDICTED: splicing factor, suppressor of white-apricot homolog isoform X2 [Camelina sativa]XP_010449066.1 PREDICTED: splicing factor, suppressor of white-apricot homolog isoform X2 [Camelina sativa]